MTSVVYLLLSAGGNHVASRVFMAGKQPPWKILFVMNFFMVFISVSLQKSNSEQ